MKKLFYIKTNYSNEFYVVASELEEAIIIFNEQKDKEMKIVEIKEFDSRLIIGG